VRAMLLAAGRGERMRPLTDTVPKPLLPVGGKPLIVWHLQALRRAGIREVIINTSWLAQQLHAALGDGQQYGVTIHWSDEGPVALETAGGIIQALAFLGPEPFLVVGADVWSDIDFARLRLEPHSLAHLVLAENPAHHPRGDFGLSEGKVVERDSGRFTYTGIGLYTPEFFAGYAPPIRLPLIEPLRRAIGAGRLSGELYRGAWCDVGTPQRLAQLEAQLARVE
jgi:N-acetyl-alpha-D-muramate 1-phosphate uridylyltransferase